MKKFVRWWLHCFIAQRLICIDAGRAYPTGCANKDPSYYNYDTVNAHMRSPDDFLLLKQLGTGKFSDVFEAMDLAHNSVVVLKCLKPVSERKVKREIKVLQACRDLTNLARLEGVVQSEGMPTLVLEHAGIDSQWLCHSVETNEYLSDYEIKYYLFHLLVALDGLHRASIIHRDVKPRNVLINKRGSSSMKPPLMLIDLGLADFYQPDTQFNVRVASRHYKSPELLTNFQSYDYAVDLWGVGCILAGLLFRRQPFFRGKDNLDQLGRIIAVLGVPRLREFLQKYDLSVTSEIQSQIDQAPEWTSTRQALLQSKTVPPPDPIALDLLERLLVYDPEERLSAREAMQHVFFDAVRDRVNTEVASYDILRRRHTQLG